MIIESIGVENYLSHRNTEVILDTGLNIFVGKNGAGKSSILEAMLVALYGTKLRRDERSITFGQSSSKVWVKFRHGNQHFQAERGFELKNGVERMKYSRLYIDEEVVEDTHTGMVERLEKELGMGQDALTSSLFIAQGQIESLISDTPAKRKENFNDILQLKNFERAQERLEPILRTLSSKLEYAENLKREIEQLEGQEAEQLNALPELKSVLEKDESVLTGEKKKLDNLKSREHDLINIKKNLEQIRSSISGRKEEIKKIEDSIKNLKNEVDKSETLRKEIENLRNMPEYVHREKIRQASTLLEKIGNVKKLHENLSIEINKYRKNLEDLDKIKKELEPFLEMKKELEKLEMEQESERKQYEEGIKIEDNFKRDSENISLRKKEKSNLENKLGTEISRMDLSKLPEMVTEKREELEQVNKQIQHESGQMEVKKKGIMDLEERIEKLKNATSCPLCGQPLHTHDHQKMIDDFHSDLQKLKEELNQIKAHSEALDKKKQKTGERLNIFTSQDMNKYASLTEDISKMEGDLSLLKERFEEVKIFMESWRKRTQRIDELNANSSKWNDLSDRLRRLEGSISSFDLEKKELDLKEYLENIRKFESQIAELGEGGRLAMDGVTYENSLSIETRIKELESDLNQLDQRLADITVHESRKGGIDIEMAREMEQERKYIEDIKPLPLIVKDREESEKKVEDLDSRIKEQRASIDRTAGIADSFKTQKETKQAEVESAAEFQYAFNFLTELKKIFGKDGIPRYMRDIAVQSITSRARELLTKFNMSIDDIKISEDLSITVTQEGNSKEISQLSGGERVAVAIAVRLAISKYLGSNISTVIMDEPTTYLDDERKMQFKEIIQGSQKELYQEGVFPQMIVITHDQELYDGADVAYEVLKRDGISEVHSYL